MASRLISQSHASAKRLAKQVEVQTVDINPERVAIGVDADEVLFKSVYQTYRTASLMAGIDLTSRYNLITSYKERWAPLSDIFPPEQCEVYFDRVWTKHWKEIPLMDPNAPFVMMMLRSRGFEVDIVTGNSNKTQVQNALKYRHIPYDNFIFNPDKQELHHRIFYDDYEKLWERLPQGQDQIARAHTWNTSVPFRVNRIDELPQKVNTLLGYEMPRPYKGLPSPMPSNGARKF